MKETIVKEGSSSICDTCDLKRDIDELRRSDREQNRKIDEMGEKIDKLTKEIKNGFARRIAEQTLEVFKLQQQAINQEKTVNSYVKKTKWTILQKVIVTLLGLLAASGPIVTWLLSR